MFCLQNRGFRAILRDISCGTQDRGRRRFVQHLVGQRCSWPMSDLSAMVGQKADAGAIVACA
jgi:hypothetical protein